LCEIKYEYGFQMRVLIKILL